MLRLRPGRLRAVLSKCTWTSLPTARSTWKLRWRNWVRLGAHFSGGGIVDVMVSRSIDGGLTWERR